MSDDDRDNDVDESDADKRAHHNALERKRRDHIKDSFSSLRDALPYFQNEKDIKTKGRKKSARNTMPPLYSDDSDDDEVTRGPKMKASRAQILKKAADYIQSMRRKNSAHQADIDDLMKQNRQLEEQMAKIEGRPVCVKEEEDSS